jgi:hypothetical protein
MDGSLHKEAGNVVAIHWQTPQGAKASFHELAPSFGLQPHLHDTLMQHIHQRVKNDYGHINAVLCTALSAYTNNPLNYFAKGPSSIGKTHGIRETLKMFPQDNIWYLGGLTPKALIHEYGVLVDEDGHEIMDDWIEHQFEAWQQTQHDGEPITSKDRKKIIKQLQRDYNALLKTSRYIVNLTGTMLVFLESPNIETWMILRPLLSHDKPETTYKFPEKTKQGSLRTKSVVLKGFPAVVCCTTDDKFLEDLSTRSLTATPNTNIEKFQEAIHLLGQRRSRPWRFDLTRDPQFMEIQEYFTRLRDTLNDNSWTIFIPYADQLATIYPHQLARDMRDFDHFLQLIHSYTLLHLFQRPRIDAPHGKLVFATMQDFRLALRLFREIEETTRSGLPGHIVQFFYDVICPLTELNATPYMQQLCEHHNHISHRKIGMDTIYSYIKHLDTVGWIAKEDDPTDKRRKVIRRVKMPKNSVFSLIQQHTPFFSDTHFTNWFNDLTNYLMERDGTYTLHFGTVVNDDDYYQSQTLNLRDTLDNPALLFHLFHSNYSWTPIETNTASQPKTEPENSGINKNQQFLANNGDDEP